MFFYHPIRCAYRSRKSWNDTYVWRRDFIDSHTKLWWWRLWSHFL